MKIIPTNFVSNLYKTSSTNNVEPNFGLKYQYGLTTDTFTRSNISFRGSTSNGTFLKHLRNIRGAYSDIVPLTGKELELIKTKIRNSTSTREKLDALAPFKRNMLPVEKDVYKLFSIYNKLNSKHDLQTILQQNHEPALKELKKEQVNIFTQIGNLATDIAPDKQKKLTEILDEAHQKITLPLTNYNKFKNKMFINSIIRLSREDDIALVKAKIETLPAKERVKAEERFNKVVHTFMTEDSSANIKGKTPLERLDMSLAEYGLKSVTDPKFEQIIDTAKSLPTSNNNINAFIVKYANRSENEIAERLVSESLGTIEHLVADSLGGENEAYNFVLATKSLNNERGNMPPSEFLKRHPDLPRTFQQNMDDVIREGNKGHLRENEWYPYVVRETIKQEYGFDIDISKYKIPPERAFRTFPKRLREKFPQFKEYFTDQPTWPIKDKKKK